MRLKAVLNSPSLSRLAGQGLISMTSLIMAVSVTGVFGARVFGAVSFFIIIANFALNILRAAVVEPAAHTVAQLGPTERKGYFGTIAVGLIVAGIVLVLPAWALVAWLTEFFLEDPAAVSAAIATSYIFAFTAAEIVRAFFQAFASNREVLYFDILRTVLTLSALALVFGPFADLWGISEPNLVMASQALTLGAATMIIALPNLASIRPAYVAFGACAAHFSMARMSTAIAAVRYLQVNSPLLWAQYLLGEEVLGIARTWQSLANVVTLPANALRLNALASGARRFEAGGMVALIAFARNFALKILAFALLMLLPMLALIWLIPEKYDIAREGLGYLLLFVAFNLLANTNTALTTAFYASGHLRVLFIRVFLALLLALAIAPWLLGEFGGLGIPMSQIGTAAFVFVMTIFVLRSMNQRPPQ